MNNMGNITLSELRVFISCVLKELDLEDWLIEWTSDVSICIKERKLILVQVSATSQIYPGYPWQAKESVLHEIAHVFAPKWFHGADFYREYVKLLTRFMIEEPI